MSCPSSCARRRADASSSARPGENSAARTSTARASSPRARRETSGEVALEFDAERIVARTQGREGWLREGRRQLEQHRWRHPDPIRRSRRERLLLAAERLRTSLTPSAAPTRPTSTTGRPRATGSVGGWAAGRTRIGRPSVPAGKVNLTDPDSRSIPIGFGFVQGYNAQAAVNEQQIVLAAEITNNSTDFSQLDPMVTATLEELERAGIDQLPEAVAADAGYWNEQHMDEVVANKHIPVLIPPDKGSRGTPRPGWTGGRYAVDATPARDRARPAALPKTRTDRRAAVRQHQAQQRRLPIPPARQGQGAHRVATTDDDPQPHQASPPPARRRGGLNRPLRRHHRRSPQQVTATGCHPRPRARAPQRVCATASTTGRCLGRRSRYTRFAQAMRALQVCEFTRSDLAPAPTDRDPASAAGPCTSRRKR